MKGIAVGACGCTVLPVLLMLAVPLFFLAGGTGIPATVRATAPLTVGGDERIIDAGGSTCDAAVGCQRIPPQLPYVPPDFFPDSYTDLGGECTSWAAALWPGHHGRGVTWSGDAWEWFADAAAKGYAVSGGPAIGAIAVFRRSASDAGEWGHVAVVIGMSDGAVRITEMNHAGRYVVDERTVPLSDPLLAGFIPPPADALAR